MSNNSYSSKLSASYPSSATNGGGSASSLTDYTSMPTSAAYADDYQGLGARNSKSSNGGAHYSQQDYKGKAARNAVSSSSSASNYPTELFDRHSDKTSF
jgi:hypothetical protein